MHAALNTITATQRGHSVHIKRQTMPITAIQGILTITVGLGFMPQDLRRYMVHQLCNLHP